MSSIAASKTTEISENRPQVAEPEHVNTATDSPIKESDRIQSGLKASDNDKNLPALYREKNLSVVGASQILAHKYPAEYSPENYQRALAELRLVLIGIGSFMFLVYMGWAAISQINFTEDGNFVYNAGLIGGLLMLVALIYAVFKRVRSLRRLLKSEALYYLHMACGAAGAYLVILHTSFDLRSINASVALVTTIFVIVSGALGRYLYTLATILLHRQNAEITDTEQSFFELIEKYEYEAAHRIKIRMSKYALFCFRKPESKLLYVTRLISILYFGTYHYLASKRDLKKVAKGMRAITNFDRKNARILTKYQERQLKQYVFHIIKMGYVSLLEQVLHHWRVFHIPALYLLTLTAVAHVVVIHMY
ncbi:MAG: hypothetical protein PVG89_16405 [Gammaproteobacteria bacterium]|jgi:hypothetical protein